MTKAEMLETMYDEFKSLRECMEYYENANNPMHDARKARDFEMRACEVCDLAEALFKVDLFTRWLDERDEAFAMLQELYS